MTHLSFRSLLPFLLAFVLLRLVFWFATFPNPDEAYYWLWAQHPGLSYYDHPGLHAWIEGLFTAAFGSSAFSLRLPNLVSNSIFFYTYYRIAQYLYGNQAPQAFWLTVMVVLASPLYFLFLALAWHDHWLITFSLVGAFLFITFLDTYLTDGQGDSWRLYAAAGAIGLAGLCKYNAVFVPIGLIAAVIAYPPLRPLLRDRRFYFAGAIAAIALIPILLWNLSNDFQSFHYYINRSVNTGNHSLKLESCLGFLVFSVLTVSPVNCLGFFRCFRQSSLRQSNLGIPAKSTYLTVAFWVFASSTLILMGVSLLSAALYYWNITAYLLLFPLLPAVFLKRSEPDCEAPESLENSELKNTRLLDRTLPLKNKGLFWGGQYFGLLFASLLVIHYSVLPISALFGPEGDPDSRMLFGWDTVAAAVTTQAKTLGGNPFLATTDYRSASALAYQLSNSTVTAISDRIDQFDFWYNSDRPFQSRNAIIVADDWHPVLPELLAQFDHTAPPITIPVTRFGVWIKNYYLIQGYNFKGGRVS